MIVNLARPSADGVSLERIEGDVFFEGGEPHEGVLATFAVEGRETTGRIVAISHAIPDDLASELMVTVEPVDREFEDANAAEALGSLSPDSVAER